MTTPSDDTLLPPTFCFVMLCYCCSVYVRSAPPVLVCIIIPILSATTKLQRRGFLTMVYHRFNQHGQSWPETDLPLSVHVTIKSKTLETKEPTRYMRN